MSDRPGLLRRLDQTGVPLAVCRLFLGVMFVSMGLAKTGVVKTIFYDTGWMDRPAVQRFFDLGLIELSDAVGFLKLMREYDMFPEGAWWAMNIVAVVLPWVETLCGLLLLLGVAIRGSALTLLGMLMAFTPMILLRAIRIHSEGGNAFCDISFNCGCGAGDVFVCSKLAENILLTLLALVALLSSSRRFCLRRNLVPARTMRTD